MLLTTLVIEVRMTSPFSAHGKTAISVAENIMTIQTRGPWNIEYFTSLHQEILEAIKAHSLVNFSVLLIPYGEAIPVHEAMDYHVNFISQGNTSAVAVNLSHCETPMSTEALCRVAYEAANIDYAFFESDEQALLYLKSKMNK